jgi:hypothetical protein
MTPPPAGDAAGRPDAGAPSPESVHGFEIRGEFDRAVAEALMLEIRRLGRQCGIALTCRVERARRPAEEASM